MKKKMLIVSPTFFKIWRDFFTYCVKHSLTEVTETKQTWSTIEVSSFVIPRQIKDFSMKKYLIISPFTYNLWI